MINYYLITKPGIIAGNLVTVAAGFLLATHGVMIAPLFVATLLGLALIIASGCVFNNYIDRHIDKKMERTKNRALATGQMSLKQAIAFATALAIGGGLILFFYTNWLTLLIAMIGFFIYVLLYSLIKCHTLWATAIGSIAGATPPLVGYTAASNHFDIGAALLFLLLVFWQMPHFFSIAIFRHAEYQAASIPTLPASKGVGYTQWRMLVYIIGFIFTTLMLSFFHYTGIITFMVTSCLGITWISLCIKGFTTTNTTRWARHMFVFSLIMILGFCLIIPIDLYFI